MATTTKSEEGGARNEVSVVLRRASYRPCSQDEEEESNAAKQAEEGERWEGRREKRKVARRPLWAREVGAGRAREASHVARFSRRESTLDLL